MNIFFYGLYMDPDILKERGVDAAPIGSGHLDGYRLRIGKNATLIAEEGAKAWGMVYSLSEEESERLYGDLPQYEPKTVVIHTKNGEAVSAWCYLLKEIPDEGEKNNDYWEKLQRCFVMYDLKIPTDV